MLTLELTPCGSYLAVRHDDTPLFLVGTVDDPQANRQIQANLEWVLTLANNSLVGIPIAWDED
jgi:hypothetical protein